MTDPISTPAPQATPPTDEAAPPAPQPTAPPPEPPDPTAPPTTPSPDAARAEQLMDVLRAQGFTDEQIEAMVAGGEPQLPTTPSTDVPQTEAPSAGESGSPPAAGSPEGAGGSSEAAPQPPAQEPPAPAPMQQRGVGSMRSAAPSQQTPLTPGQERRMMIERKSYL